MPDASPKIDLPRREIRQLDDAAINRIAAGEVVERPASAIKELIENAIDAGASQIDIAYAAGGKSVIRVADNGAGIPAEELPLALSRHATSKIDGSDLLNITTFGFRGEALASLGAVGRLSLTSRGAGRDGAFRIRVHDGVMSGVEPAALSAGTIVELTDLFHTTPARLRFLRSDRAEAQAIGDVVRRLAMAEPAVGFSLRDITDGGAGRTILKLSRETGDFFDALTGRLRRILGAEFTENAVPIDARRDDFGVTGLVALPTYSRGSAVAQYLFVNGRPVRDKLLIGAVRGAYADFLSRDRHPAVMLNIDCPPELVDVNVHPAKSEVRFRDPASVRGMIVSAIRHTLAGAGHRSSSTVSRAALGAIRPMDTTRVYQMDRPPARNGFSETPAGFGTDFGDISARVEPDETDAQTPAQDAPLGAARAQLHENYIIAQTRDGLVIVDQHAAHERLVYERLKAQQADKGVAAQALLIPEIVSLSGTDAAMILEAAETLARCGLEIEPFGGDAVAVRATPAILGEVNAEHMVRDVLDELKDQNTTTTVMAGIEAVLSRIACHGSVRSGRRMQAEEMNALLREMEATPHSGQCNHGRPTYVELKLTDIERLFGRT